jgi:flagellar hook-associated protein 1 FlgK
MTSTALFAIATRALLTHQSAMTVVSHNIANASVPGYSRQQAELATSNGMFDGAGFFGRGVHVETVTRSYNEFLTRQAAITRSHSGYDTARSEQLRRIEQVFMGGEQGLGAATNEFLNAMVDLASRPQDMSARQVVLSRAGNLAARYESAAAQLDETQAGVTQDLSAQVDRANQLATQIAAVNQQIVAQRGTGHTPNDLLDQRDRMVSDLSEMLSVTTIEAEDGSIGVFIAGGQRLVLGAQAAPLSLTPDTFDRSRMALAITESSGPRPLTSDLLGSGSIAGLMRFQNEDLVDARNMIGQMAASLAYAVNGQQALGLDMGAPPGAGAPIFGIGSPQVLPAQNNARDGSGAFTANVTLAVEDARQMVASEYSLAHDGSSWQLTRLSDGTTRSVTSGDVVDGLRIDLGTPAPATTDRFLLQPLTRAARSMSVVLDDPRGVAAASPVTASVNGANTGTGSVASLRVVDDTVDPQLTASIRFDSDSGDYTWELRDRDTNALASTGTGTWTAGEPIAINGVEVELSGVPKTGDVFTVEKTAFPASNNGNALAMADLRDLGLVGAVDDGSGGVTGGRTFTDAWASAMADIGVRVQGATTAAELSEANAASAQTALSNVSGVNLDEEAAKLMQVQQSYQAAAKILQSAQAIFDTLLSMIN